MFRSHQPISLGTFAAIGLTLLALAFLVLALTSCAPAPADLCVIGNSFAPVPHADGSLTFNLMRGREAVRTGITLDDLKACAQSSQIEAQQLEDAITKAKGEQHETH